MVKKVKVKFKFLCQKWNLQKLTSGSWRRLPNSQECSSDLVQLVPLHVCVWVVSPLSGGPFTPMVWSCSNIGMALRRVHKLVVDHVKCFKKNRFCKPTCDTFVSWSILVKSSRTVTDSNNGGDLEPHTSSSLQRS